MKKIIFTKEDVECIIELYSRNKTISEISKNYSVSRKTIKNLLEENNVYKKSGNYGISYNWSPSDIENIKERYTKENLSANEIAKTYGCYDTTILKILKDNGVDTSRKRKNHNFKKYNVNEHFFETIDNEEKSYWLGFLLADGHITNDGKIMLTLQSSDLNHIYKFRESIASNHPIKKVNGQDAHSIVIGSSIMASDIRNKGISNRKSWEYDIIEIASYIPNNLINHFVRGYFDGDGSVGIYNQTYSKGFIYNASIVGIECMVEYIKNVSLVEGYIRYDKRTTNSHTLYIRKKDEVKKFGEYIYNDANIYMNRKRVIFDNIK